MLKAVSEIRVNKKYIRKTAIEFSIPYQTLRDRISGDIYPDNFGRETLFTEEKVLGLVEFTEVMERFGYRVSNAALQNYAGEMAFRFGRKPVDRSSAFAGCMDFCSRELYQRNHPLLKVTGSKIRH
ncbi:hypothetical protein DPMN_031254 [Dreissena polymorpha]|uniref:HTH psq-type domain-containing protein n=1 Tax=Dreissena polymorpha TaxID=45954 RepID=A0A9D4LZM6_DREPO|nr:hypothetical protein DPMN_031254 [Dreissena polymorpha]